MKRCLILVVLFVTVTIYSQAQSSSVMFDNAIAYIGIDNNVYLTDLTRTVALTDDAFTDENGDYLRYDNPTWSSDGQTLAFITLSYVNSTNTTLRDITIVRSGQSPFRVPLSQDIAIADSKIAISPDGIYIAFFGSDTDNQGLFIANIETGSTNHLATDVLSGVGGPSLSDPATGLISRMRGFDYTLGQRQLIWSERGLLYLSVSLKLLTVEGEVVWQSDALTNFLISPDGNHAVAQSMINNNWVEIDLSTGETTHLPLPENASPLGWITDQLYYRTQTNTVTIQTDENITEGIALFGFDWGYFAVSSSQNNIFAYMPDTDDVLVTTIYGYDIGLISGAENTTMIVRYVTSNIPAVILLHEGTPAQQIQDFRSQEVNLVVRIAYKGSGVNASLQETIAGSQAIVGKGEFTVITPN